MGQLVAVTETPSTTQGLLRFELNRALTGMGHERFASLAEADGDRPAAVLARRLLATGQVDAVHVYSNIVTVELARGGDAAPLPDIVRTLYRYWGPGMAPPSFEDLTAPDDGGSDSSAASAAPAADGGGDVAQSAAAQRVPAHLLERARAARERWRAKAG